MSTDPAADTDVDLSVPAVNAPRPPAYTHVRYAPCPLCDDGQLWQNEHTGELICDTCHGVPEGEDDTSFEGREDPYARDHDTYDHSGRRRCYGGYTQAYFSDNGAEYALDTYGDETDGLLVPHKRDWAYDLV